MNRHVAGLLCVVSFAATGCFIPKDATPRVALGGEFATKFVHRGMTNNDRGVFQPRLAIELPTVTGDRIRVTARGNMDLTNSTGNAWFPNGHAGKFTEVDFIAEYQKKINDVFSVRGGVFNYNLPNGQEFPNGERGATTEVFATVSANVLEFTPYFSWHYDFDEVHAAYYRAGMTESFDLGNDFTIVLDGSLGYASSAQAAWLYGLDASGFADLRGKAVLNWMYDERTQLSCGVHGSMIYDNGTLDSWFNDVAVFDDDPIWFTMGVNWVF